jgi:glycosyltransferase involved in cell wall biosynthesis
MKVLMFGWEFPPHIAGGLGTACYGLTKGLAKNKVEVLFVMPHASGDEDETAVRILNASDVELFSNTQDLETFWTRVNFLEIGSNLIPYLGPEEFETLANHDVKGTRNKDQFVGFGQKYNFSGKYGANLLEEVARYALVAASISMHEQFDVIHAHDWLTYIAGIVAKKVSGKPLVIHVHATEFDRSGENINQQVYEIERWGMMEADRVITVSNLTRNIVINRYGIAAEKVITVHNAVDFQGHSSMNVERGVEDKVVTFLGRITYQKGPEYFIEAAAKVLKSYPNVHFVMAGSGDMFNRSIRRVARLGIAPRFHFTGFLQGADVQRMFAHSDVYVMPSVSEPFGISPLEAMRSNVPTIISKQSGVAEVLKYAIKVDFWDVNALADAIHGLLAYPALSKMAIRCGLEEVNALKWDNAAIQVKKVYESAVIGQPYCQD